jgi:hypothetical protein
VCGTSDHVIGWGMSIELSDIDVIASERSLPCRWTVRRDGELDVSERRPRLMGEGVHAMQWQGPVQRAVGEALVIEVFAAVRAYFACGRRACTAIWNTKINGAAIPDDE